MSFQITKIDHQTYPSRSIVAETLGHFGSDIEALVKSLAKFECHTPPRTGDRAGYQQNIAESLEDWLSKFFESNGCTVLLDRRYSNKLNEMCDVLMSSKSGQRAYIEVEFRPNIEKDLVKFQIGYNTRLLGLAILIVAIDRDSINPGYTTMPEYQKVARIIGALQPEFPVLLIGIDGMVS